MNKEAKNFEAISKAIKKHNQDCPSPPTGVAMAPFDIERLGWEEGDNVCGIPIVSDDSVQPERFRILCSGQHSGNSEEASVEEPEETFADSLKRERDLVTV